jgi:hypothetical protein
MTDMSDTTQTTPPPADDEAAKAAAAEAAKADTEKASAEKQAAPKAGKPAPALDRDLIARLAADVADNIGVRQAHFDLLVERLTKDHRLKFRKTSEGRTYARMAGIEAGSRGSEREALINWGNAARRALNQLAA